MLQVILYEPVVNGVGKDATDDRGKTRAKPLNEGSLPVTS